MSKKKGPQPPKMRTPEQIRVIKDYLEKGYYKEAKEVENIYDYKVRFERQKSLSEKRQEYQKIIQEHEKMEHEKKQAEKPVEKIKEKKAPLKRLKESIKEPKRSVKERRTRKATELVNKWTQQTKTVVENLTTEDFQNLKVIKKGEKDVTPFGKIADISNDINKKVLEDFEAAAKKNPIARKKKQQECHRFYTKCLEVAFENKDYNTAFAIYQRLTDRKISNLAKVTEEGKKTLEKAARVFDPAGGFAKYAQEIKDSHHIIPWGGAIGFKINYIKENSKGKGEEFQRDWINRYASEILSKTVKKVKFAKEPIVMPQKPVQDSRHDFLPLSTHTHEVQKTASTRSKEEKLKKSEQATFSNKGKLNKKI